MVTDVKTDQEAGKSSGKLYPDFILTSDNCHREPIHRPTAIQGNGHLLVISNSTNPSLLAISEKLAPSMGLATDTLWSMQLSDWLPNSIMEIANNIDQADFDPRNLPEKFHLEGGVFEVIYYQHGENLVVELEPESNTEVDDQLIRTTAQAFRASDNLESLYAEATKTIARSFGFDRAMIYQFDQDQHGCVVGEYKIDSLEAFLGLHYPESDIPKIARDLFLLVKSRAISDVGCQYTRLAFHPNQKQDAKYLDLSKSQLRATSPIHIQYLQNMGVKSSLTFAIIIQGKLWGLIACHHGKPRQVLFNHKLIGEVISDLLAKRIVEIESEKRRTTEERARRIETALLQQVKLSDNYRIQIIERSALIRDLCEADGAALVSLDQCVYVSGIAPEKSTLIAIRNWLVSNGHDEVFNTSHFTRDIPVPVKVSTQIGGLLSSCICTVSDSYLMWFKHPETKVVDWAGNPENSFSIEVVEGVDDVRLSPRQSFAKWQVKVEGQSTRWEQSALDMADRVQQGFFKKELRYTAMLTERNNSEFLQLTFAAAHDLQEPMRTQSNYLDLLRESIKENAGKDDILHCVDKTEASINRMKMLVTDLLNYSQLGVSASRERVDLSSVVSSVSEELSLMIDETQTILSIGELPAIIGDPGKVEQLIRNLLTNAIKYVAPSTKPEISIYTEQDGSFWTLNVKDNGIGIDTKYHSDIFVMFKRLHGKKEYDGTGIGLAICKKVADMMGAEIGLTSASGEGSTFWLRFHNSAIEV